MPRSKPNYLYAVVSVALVLFIAGVFALTALHARKLITIFKQKVDIWLELSPEAGKDASTRIMEEVKRQSFVLGETVRFIPKEQAEADMRRDLGADNLLNDMPNMMRDVIRFNVKAGYLSQDSLTLWRDSLRRDSAVAELYFEQAPTGNVSANLERLGYLALALGLLMLGVTITLIHNTIRLALYTNRFIVKNQELVGASWSFISRPFLRRGMLNGLWSAMVAIGGLSALLAAIKRQLPEISEIQDVNLVIAVFLSLVLLGVLISGLSTYFVVHKFLRMRIDDLY